MTAATVVARRLIRQELEVVSVLLEKMLKASANHLDANRRGGSMKQNSVSRKIGVVFTRVGIILKP